MVTCKGKPFLDALKVGKFGSRQSHPERTRTAMPGRLWKGIGCERKHSMRGWGDGSVVGALALAREDLSLIPWRSHKNCPWLYTPVGLALVGRDRQSRDLAG